MKDVHRRQIARAAVLLAIAVLAASIAFVTGHRSRRADRVERASTAMSIPAVPQATGMQAPPRLIRRDSVRVPLSTERAGADFWQMHEAAPLIERDEEARPVTVLLHGMCADSSWTCDWLQYFEMAPQWQVCPRAPRKCGAEPGYSWTSGAETLRVIELSLARLKQRQGARVRDDSLVLAGFSLGAYAVADLAHELARAQSSPLQVRGILAQGARVHFFASDVRKLGARVALAAGDLDAAAPAMRAEAEKLAREGIDVHYESLGADESHFTSVSTGKVIARLIDWCRTAPGRPAALR